ncbi:molybdenum cofactor biosynthesis protein MoaE [Arthrobacter sp. Br18]|uniref:molybdenum cofactor biosynthesis protein MoaE n=1 Tax=Arthrobacter sp. Br18 TaxID=1312954 RepID=UPI00047AF7E7|nr:molybdenum cofactor biosynthesis protein MoaE [Arthrobacter sp. Br18]
MGEVVHAAVSAGRLATDDALAAVDSAACGAVVGFSGVVRNHDGGKDVASLSYSAHPSAERTIREVAEEIAARYDGVRIWVAHRVGPLEIGDSALVAAVAAGHRGEAFAACSALVDAVKDRVPIWKEQFFSDGTVEWVGAGA